MQASTQNIWLTWTASESTALTLGNNPWLGQQTAATNSTISYDYWARWVQQSEETTEQRRERQRLQAEATQRRRDIEAARKAASERAEKLLNACLNAEQRDRLAKEGFFEVRTKSGRIYRIRRGRARNVWELTTRKTYCCHPVDHVPDADTMLAQKLMLETQEEEFLRLANVS